MILQASQDWLISCLEIRSQGLQNQGKLNLARRRQSGFVRKLADYFTMASFFLVVALVAAYFGKLGETSHQGPFVVVDGDSLSQSGVKFRLEGIDAPEYRQTCRKDGVEWACGREAAKFLRQQMRRGNPRCRGVGLDKYERILVQCATGDKQINREMVSNGWAVSFGDFQREERSAREKGLGVWQGEFLSPRQWREIYGNVEDGEVVSGIVDQLGSKIRYWMFEIKNWWSGKE